MQVGNECVVSKIGSEKTHVFLPDDGDARKVLFESVCNMFEIFIVENY